MKKSVFMKTLNSDGKKKQVKVKFFDENMKERISIYDHFALSGSA